MEMRRWRSGAGSDMSLGHRGDIWFCCGSGSGGKTEEEAGSAGLPILNMPLEPLWNRNSRKGTNTVAQGVGVKPRLGLGVGLEPVMGVGRGCGRESGALAESG